MMSKWNYRASILTGYATGADETGATQLEETRQLGLTETLLAVVGVDNGNVDFLQNVLEVALISESVFTPSGNPASTIANIE